MLVINKEKHLTYTYEQLHTVTRTGKGALRSFRKQPLKELNNSAHGENESAGPRGEALVVE